MIMSKVIRGDNSGCPPSQKPSAPDAAITRYLIPRQKSVNTRSRMEVHHAVVNTLAANRIAEPTNINTSSRSVRPNIKGLFMVGSLSKGLSCGNTNLGDLEPAAPFAHRAPIRFPGPVDGRQHGGPASPARGATQQELALLEAA